MYHQICMAHLLRDLHYLVELYAKSGWATEMKILIEREPELIKQLTAQQYYGPSHEKERMQENFIKLPQT